VKFRPDRCPICNEYPVGTVELVLAEMYEPEEEGGSFQYTGDTNLDVQSSIRNELGEVLVACESGHTWFASCSEPAELGEPKLKLPL
jgi:hypothetical protein